MTTPSNNDAVLAAPPIGVGALTLWGVPLNEWVLIGSLIWTVFLIIDKAPTVYIRLRGLARFIKDRRHGSN